MSWIILFFAGLFEVGWAVGLKYTDGFSKPIPTVLTVGAMVISLGLLGLAMKELPLGTAYAIWTGVGAVGTVIAGIRVARQFCRKRYTTNSTRRPASSKVCTTSFKAASTNLELSSVIT